MRRLRKPRPETPKIEKNVVKKKAPACVQALPEIQPGEDDISFQRHNRVLQAEWSKVKRNVMMVEELMERTFPMRRREILENSCDVQTLFKKFPFLQDPEQVIVVNFYANVRCVWVSGNCFYCIDIAFFISCSF